jgi:hypothetical protein
LIRTSRRTSHDPIPPYHEIAAEGRMSELPINPPCLVIVRPLLRTPSLLTAEERIDALTTGEATVGIDIGRTRPPDAAPRTAVPDAATKYLMARDLAGTVFPVSADLILREARKHGIGRRMGRVIIFSPDDCQQLYEVLPPCHSSSFAAPNHRIGSCAAPSGASALKKLQALLTDDSPKKSAPSARAKSSRNRSMVVALPACSRKQP